MAAFLSAMGAAGPTQAATVDPNAWYVLVHRCSGKALDVSGADTGNGASLQQWTRIDSANQRFQFIDSGGGYYRLKAQHSGKALVSTTTPPPTGRPSCSGATSMPGGWWP
ncbi:RICIN domain-containing protein [Streptomyces sp. NBC_00287]|uniref:RICIN domain-containing protein n=1 Tax=Streptomyces sp. NBC_00287 TaxID=2975702 RepID=UPI002E2CA2C3|nr:RICIN domain-containing protein [Streptomyces sp. NBC_00287]